MILPLLQEKTLPSHVYTSSTSPFHEACENEGHHFRRYQSKENPRLETVILIFFKFPFEFFL